MKLSLFLAAICFSATCANAQVSASWRLLENEFADTGFHRAEIVLTNTLERPLGAGWKLYFNTVFLSVYPEVDQSDMQIKHLQGDFFVLEGKSQSPALNVGAEFRIEYRSRGPFLKNAHAPEGLIFLQADGTYSEISDFKQTKITTDEYAAMATKTPLPVPTASRIYVQNQDLSTLPESELPPFLPSPKSWKYNGNALKIKNAGLAVVGTPEFAEVTKYLLLAVRKGYKPKVNSEEAPIQIRLIQEEGFQEEGYKISITERKVRISASTSKGIFYGVQSFLAMMPAGFWELPSEEFVLPQVEITDYPAFGYRGFFLDVARNFQPKAEILKVLDLMAFYKLNAFHFNLANDEGWRIEIPGLPELTDFGSKRGFSVDESEYLWPYYASGADPEKDGSGSGFYSIADFKEILAYAKARHIEVIPELGVPAHSRAAILAMEKRFERLSKEGKMEEGLAYRLADPDDQSRYLSAQNFRGNTVCVCQESTYAFYEKIVREVKSMFLAADVPLTHWHTGGDEVPRGVWTASPICADFLKAHPTIKQEELTDYFRNRTALILKANGLEMGGWEEIGQSHSGNSVIPNTKFADQNWRLYAWNAVAGWGGEDMGYRLANAGYPVVICSSANFYFDLAYDWDPEERGHTWSGVTDMYQAWKTVPGKLYLSHDQTIDGGEWKWEDKAASFTKLTSEGKKNLIGVSGQVWTETIKSPEMLEYYILPKMLGYVERAWGGDPAWSESTDEEEIKEKRMIDWNRFANQVGQKEFSRLESQWGGLKVRLPKPGLMVKDGLIYANVQTPGVIIRYTQDGSLPSVQSSVYEGPIRYQGGEKFSTFSLKGSQSRVSSLD